MFFMLPSKVVGMGIIHMKLRIEYLIGVFRSKALCRFSFLEVAKGPWMISFRVGKMAKIHQKCGGILDTIFDTRASYLKMSRCKEPRQDKGASCRL